jgi:hypothetical protein
MGRAWAAVEVALTVTVGLPIMPAKNVVTKAVWVTETALGTVTVPLDVVQTIPQFVTVVRQSGVTAELLIVSPVYEFLSPVAEL